MVTRAWLLGESQAADEESAHPWRPVRTAVVGVSALVLAYGGHRIAGGLPVRPGALLVPAVVMVAGSWVMSSRRS